MRSSRVGRGGTDAHAYRAATLRPRYSASDVAALMWRERAGMFLVFALLFAAGAAFAFTLPKTYTARSSLLVKLGQEYVYEPRAGDAARGAIPGKDEVIQSEMEILGSDALKRRVVEAVGLHAVDPKLADAWARAGADERRRIEAKAVKALGDGLGMGTAPDTGVIRLSYKHKDPEAAATILNRFVETYLDYRREVFSDASAPVIERQRRAFEERLAAADGAYGDFLQRNGVGDFAAEKQSYVKVYDSVLDERFKVEARLREVRQQLATLSSGLAGVPQETGVHRDLDLTAPDKLLQLKIKRQDLLSRYKPEAQPVKDLDAEIAQLETLVAGGKAVTDKEMRLGANPVWQDLQTEKIRLEAEASSLEARRNELARQVAEVSGRLLKLAELDSEFQTLSVEREVLQSNIRAFATRQQQTQAADAIAEGVDDNIRIVERAVAPAEGKSLKKLVFLGAFAFAAFTALCFGLVRVFLRKGFSTPGSASRTLDLPVLATAPIKVG